jgi:acyl carrier protein
METRKLNAIPNKPTAALRQWILDAGGHADDGMLQTDTHLVDAGYIDSLGLISLILHVERLRGAPIADAQMSMQNFVSIEKIEQTFFRGSSAHA